MLAADSSAAILAALAEIKANTAKIEAKLEANTAKLKAEVKANAAEARRCKRICVFLSLSTYARGG